MTAQQPAIRSLHVIYDADGSVTGELLYMAKKLLGLAHCAACDITHGPRAEKPEFTALKRTRWRVPLENIHRDEMDPVMAARVDGRLPCVAATLDAAPASDDPDSDVDAEKARQRRARDVVVVVEPGELERCNGELDCFERAVDHGAKKLGLTLERADVCSRL